MKKSDTHRNLPLLLLKTREALMEHFRPILKEHALSEQQWRVLRVLSEHHSLEPHEISSLCSILSPSLAGVLSRMADLDLIEKHNVPNDMRRLIIKLTPKSKILVKKISKQNEACYQALEEIIGKDEISLLYKSLDIILFKLNQKSNRSGKLLL